MLQEEGFKFCSKTRNNGALPLDPSGLPWALKCSFTGRFTPYRSKKTPKPNQKNKNKQIWKMVAQKVPPVFGDLAILGTSNCRLSTPPPPTFGDLVIIGTSNCRLNPYFLGTHYPAILGTSNCRFPPDFGDLEVVGTSDCRLPRPPWFLGPGYNWDLKICRFPPDFWDRSPGYTWDLELSPFPPGYFWDLARLPVLSLWNRVFLFFQFCELKSGDHLHMMI